MIHQILEFVKKEGVVSISELSRKLDLDQVIVKRIIEMLAKRKLLRIRNEIAEDSCLQISKLCKFCPLSKSCGKKDMIKWTK